MECKDSYGRTPLLVAASRGNYLVVELLVSYGADVDAMGGFVGGTALHASVYHRHNGVATLLINNFASPFIENAQGVTPMDLACKQGNVELLRHMESKAIFCGWIEQKIPRYGFGYEWISRWVVISQRLKYLTHGTVQQHPHVRIVLLCYENLSSVNATCKSWLDNASASFVRANQRNRNPKMQHAAEVQLDPDHPHVRGGYTTKNNGRLALHFRPTGLDHTSRGLLSDFISYVNWGSQLHRTGSHASPESISTMNHNSREHWALNPPEWLPTAGLSMTQTDDTEENNNNNATPVHVADTESDAALARALQESENVAESTMTESLGLERNDTTGLLQSESSLTQNSEKPSECLICMDEKIEVIFCHPNQTYVVYMSL